MTRGVHGKREVGIPQGAKSCNERDKEKGREDPAGSCLGPRVTRVKEGRRGKTAM